MVRLKFGALVTAMPPVSYVSNNKLGRIFKCSGGHIRNLYLARFEKIRQRNISLQERVLLAKQKPTRTNWGVRFLRKDQIDWLVSSATLKRQTAMSLTDRTKDFLRNFPTAHLKPCTLRQVYKMHGVKQKSYIFYKVPRG